MDSADAHFSDGDDTSVRLYALSDGDGNGNPAQSYLNVDGIQVEAIANEDARASIDGIRAEASNGGYAEVNIGDISGL